MTDFEILIGKGFKELSFGDRFDKIRNVLGEPDKIDEKKYADNSISKDLEYNDLNIILTLGSEDDYRLTDILIFNSKFHIKNQIFVGINKSQALDLATKLDFGDYIIEDYRSIECPTHELAMFDKVSLLLLLSCEKEEKNPTLDDFCKIKPYGWDCEIIQKDFDKNDIPRNAKEPIVIIKYKNTNREFIQLSDKKAFPSLILDLYPIEQKQELIELVKSQQFYSWCVPIYYGETKDYFILTSPCFINGGTFTEQADSSIIDLQSAIKKIITKRNYDLVQN